MRRPCRERLAWNADWHCPRSAVVAGLCVTHLLDRFRWEWDVGPHRATLDLSNMNRPHVSFDDDRPRRWVSVEWGNGSSDPVASLFVRFRRDGDG